MRTRTDIAAAYTGASGAAYDRMPAIAGVGCTPFYRRGGTVGRTAVELACAAILDSLCDAGLTADDVDGFALFSGGLDVGLLVETLGIPEIRFAATVAGSGGGSAGSVGLASAAIASGMASVVVSVVAVQQLTRMGAALAPGDGSGQYAARPTAQSDFTIPAGLLAPGQAFAMIAARHMHEFGTRREDFAEVAISTRANATRRETALMRTPLTLEQYLDSRIIADPLCLYDHCLESEGAVAIVTTSLARARGCRNAPVRVLASAHGGSGDWGRAIGAFNMPDSVFASSGHTAVARTLYGRAGLSPSDVDVALLYDHFSPMVIMQLEDYGFCLRGEGGPFVREGNIRWPGGALPVNTHGGNLSEAYILGMTHILEAVEQIRGTAVNQVPDAEVALVTGGPAPVPVSALLLGRE
jgi:acetyl-CoA acetyltransferase